MLRHSDFAERVFTKRRVPAGLRVVWKVCVRCSSELTVFSGAGCMGREGRDSRPLSAGRRGQGVCLRSDHVGHAVGRGRLTLTHGADRRMQINTDHRLLHYGVLFD